MSVAAIVNPGADPPESVACKGSVAAVLHDALIITIIIVTGNLIKCLASYFAKGKASEVKYASESNQV